MKFDQLVKLIIEDIEDVPFQSKHIEFNQYNLKAKYDEFNRKLFNNELPNIPIEWASLKGVGGITVCKLQKTTNTSSWGSKYSNREIVPNTLKIRMSLIII